jgi:MFS family permease
MTLSILYKIYPQNPDVLSIYYLAIIGSSIVGPIISNKIEKVHFLYFWMILGTAVSPLILLVEKAPIVYVMTIFTFLGISFGLGMPASLTYFANFTSIENRGRMAGVIFLFTALIMPITRLMFESPSLLTSSIINTIWRGIGVVLFFSLKPGQTMVSQSRKPVSYESIFQNRTFILYFIPWFMFGFVDQFGASILSPAFVSQFGYSPPKVGPLVGSLFAFVGGIFADLFGRKRVIISSFIALGIAYAVIGIAPTFLISWYFHFVIDGMAWGVFFISFVLILWGDLSLQGAREKYYAVGNIPFFLSGVIWFLLAPYASIPASSAFSLASFFLFLAVLPLMYAPETLPEKKIRLRQLRSYVETAKKLREKYLKKSAAN